MKQHTFELTVAQQLTAGLKKLGLQWFIEHSTSHQHLCYVDSFELRNPLLRKAANRQTV